MLAARGGDRRSYASALASVAKMARDRIGYRIGFGDADLEDVVQEVLIAVHAKNHTWDAERPIEPWINAICDHKSVDRLRRRSRNMRMFTTDDAIEHVPAPSWPNFAETSVALDRAIAALPRGQGVVVRALGLGGHTISSAATALKMTEVAVRVAFHRGLKALRAMASTVDAIPRAKQDPMS